MVRAIELDKVSQSGSKSEMVRAGGQQILHKDPSRKAERPRSNWCTHRAFRPNRSPGSVIRRLLPTVGCVEGGGRKVCYPACILQLEQVRIARDVLVASDLIGRTVPTTTPVGVSFLEFTEALFCSHRR